MKMPLFITAIAALSLAALAVIFAADTVPIQGNYSKSRLDDICADAGGKSYGDGDKAYGCSRENVTVECWRDGSCKGYVYFQIAASRSRIADPAALLMQSPTAKEVATSAPGDTLTQQR
ncbi:MAG: hypothetical protein R3D05_12825 [Dongiaceae bacterium]